LLASRSPARPAPDKPRACPALRAAQEGQPRAAPFLFATVKGYTGHQESAAGAVGLVEASQLVQRLAAPPALHLRHLNPHLHAPLARQPVSVARGGPYGLPTALPDGRLLVGVSSFGAQGTNAHALLRGTGAPAAPAAGGAGPAWRGARCWVAPRAQALLGAAWVHRRGRGRGATVTFEANLAAPALAYLWEYTVFGRPHLPGAAALGVAASALPLLSTEEAPLGALLDLTLPAPLALPRLSRGPAGALVPATLVVRPAAAAAEVIFQQQKVLAGRFGCTRVQPFGHAIEGAPGAGALRAAVRRAAAGTARPAPAITGTIAPPEASQAAAYALHPALLDASFSQTALCMPSSISPPTWLRSAAAVVLPLAARSPPPGGVHVATAAREEDGWAVGGVALGADSFDPGAGGVHLQGVCVGEHDLAPTSPGPASLTPAAASTRSAGDAAPAAGEEGAHGAPEGEEGGGGAGLAADHPLLAMGEEERMLHLQAQVMTEVRNVVGRAIHPDEPLMAAGLDSRGGMELRRTLAEALGMQLPVTLLYDYQSISAIVDYINAAVVAAAGAAAAGAGGGAGSSGDDSEDEGGGRAVVRARATAAGGGGALAAAPPRTSKLLKTLRPPPTQRPLFLAAPGVANAQSAYFSFSMFLQVSVAPHSIAIPSCWAAAPAKHAYHLPRRLLAASLSSPPQWSTQPIYVLDKDNDLDLRALALQNAADIVAVQPEGPYLVGGHSYGGAVAVEIAMVLEGWGREVGLVLVRERGSPASWWSGVFLCLYCAARVLRVLQQASLLGCRPLRHARPLRCACSSRRPAPPAPPSRRSWTPP
jgi:acyl carrier protein